MVADARDCQLRHGLCARLTEDSEVATAAKTHAGDVFISLTRLWEPEALSPAWPCASTNLNASTSPREVAGEPRMHLRHPCSLHRRRARGGPRAAARAWARRVGRVRRNSPAVRRSDGRTAGAREGRPREGSDAGSGSRSERAAGRADLALRSTIPAGGGCNSIWTAERRSPNELERRRGQRGGPRGRHLFSRKSGIRRVACTSCALWRRTARCVSVAVGQAGQWRYPQSSATCTARMGFC